MPTYKNAPTLGTFALTRQQDVTTLLDAIDQIESLQRALAEKQMEVDVLTGALDYARHRLLRAAN